jgi:hypothetical protein
LAGDQDFSISTAEAEGQATAGANATQVGRAWELW